MVVLCPYHRLDSYCHGFLEIEYPAHAQKYPLKFMMGPKCVRLPSQELIQARRDVKDWMKATLPDEKKDRAVRVIAHTAVLVMLATVALTVVIPVKKFQREKEC